MLCIPRGHMHRSGKPGTLSPFSFAVNIDLSASLSKLLGPVDGVDVDAKGVFAQPINVARRLHDNADDGAPPLGGGKLTVLVTAFDPGDAEAVGRGPDNTGHFDSDLDLPDFCKRVVIAGVVVERGCAAIGCEIVRPKPILA